MATCATMPATLLEMIASTLQTDANGDTFFNTVDYTGVELTSAITCDIPAGDLEAFIVANGFTTDAQGKPAIKLGKHS
jgi:hypothetical protein